MFDKIIKKKINDVIKIEKDIKKFNDDHYNLYTALEKKLSRKILNCKKLDIFENIPFSVDCESILDGKLIMALYAGIPNFDIKININESKIFDCHVYYKQCNMEGILVINIPFMSTFDISNLDINYKNIKKDIEILEKFKIFIDNQISLRNKIK
jgi:hypothetical protein